MMLDSPHTSAPMLMRGNALVLKTPVENALRDSVCCLLVLNTVTSTPQWRFEPVLRNTCHGPRTSLPQHAFHSIDHVQDARNNYVERATAVAQEQYKSLLAGLQAVGQVKG
jgi:hypothetical protein